MTFSQSVSLELIKAFFAWPIAVSIFVFGQMIQRFVFEPVAVMRKLVGQIGHDLIFYGNRFSAPNKNTPEEWIEATTAYRKHAAALRSLPLTIPFYNFTAKVFSFPTRKHARDASSSLIGISNTPWNADSNDFAFKNRCFDNVYFLLKIPKD